MKMEKQNERGVFWYRKDCGSFGRNGWAKTIGLEFNLSVDKEIVTLQPTTSKGKPQALKVEFPKEAIPTIINLLKKL